MKMMMMNVNRLSKGIDILFSTDTPQAIIIDGALTHQTLLGTEGGAAAEGDGGDEEGERRPGGVHVEVVDVLEQARQRLRVREAVADQTHQQAGASGHCDPPLLAGVPVAAVLVVVEVAGDVLLGHLCVRAANERETKRVSGNRISCYR